MSDHVEGLVAKITEKPTRNGGTMYNVCLEIAGGEDEWFGYGFDKPEFFEGDEIEFDIEYNGDYANVDAKSVNILSEGEGEKKPAPRGRSNGRSGGRQSSSRSAGSSRGGSSRSSKPAAKRSGGNKSTGGADDKMSKEDWANKDKIIRRQACMNTAIQLIGAAVKCDLVALPTKKADKLDAFIALCDEEAIRLYDQYEEQVYGTKTKKRGGSSRNNDDYDDDIPQ